MKASYPAKKSTSLLYGYYPIGYYHSWHGGIHIEGLDTEIKAMADGKIIAFRDGKNIEVGIGKGGKKVFVSNSFVLIRHDYESSGDKKMTFYSLYQHLSFGSQQQKEENKPKEQKQESTYTVKVKTPQQESGVLSLDSSTFIPLYSKVEIQTEDEKQGIYKVVFEGKTIVIPREKKDKKTLNNEGQVVFWGDKLKDRGLLLYSEARKNAPTKGVVKDGEKITILNKFEVQGKDKKHTWYKIKYQEKEGFVLEEHLATKPSENKENQKKDAKKTTTKPKSLPKFLENQTSKDEVVTCDIDVKAGEFIGYVGKQGLMHRPEYCAAHIEVFTPDNGEDFISNKEAQGENEKFYFELSKGTELKPYLKINFMSPIYHKGTRVKVISKTDKYTRVEPLEKIVIGRANNWTFLGDIDKDGNVITKYPIAKNERKSFWIENLFVGQEEHKGEKGNKNNVLTTSLPHIYLTDPELEAKKRNKSVHYEDKLSQKVVVDIRLCKEKVKYDAAEWIYVKSHYYREGKTIYNQGWVEIPKKEERFSAYHWDKFGFKTYEAGKERFYKVEGILQEEETSPFITEVIKRIDTNGNKKIDHFELRNSYNTSEVSHILSRMVCKHKNEWSYDVDKIKQDTKAYFEKIKNHFKQEYEPQKGKTEAENENLSKHLDNLLDSVLLKAKALYFWDEQFAKKTGLPADGFVWHFEPFAWVEQMKRVFSVSKWHEPVASPQRTLFNSGGRHKPVSGYFGAVRTNGTKNHGGIDIFAPIGEPIYACLDGEVVSAQYRGKTKTTGYGNTIIIKVAKEDLEACRNNYKLEFPNPFGNGKGEVEKGKGFGDSDERYLLYAHLDTMFVKKGDKVTAGQQIGTGGKTGNAETIKYERNRHLHFEVLSSPSTAGYSELLNRENPAFYVNFIEADINKQENNQD